MRNAFPDRADGKPFKAVAADIHPLFFANNAAYEADWLDGN